MPRLSGPIILLGLVALFTVAACTSNATSTNIRQVSPSEAVELLDTYTVIDVRTPEEFATGHIAGAINIPVEAADFEARIDPLERTDPYLLYCRSGRRSGIATETMKDAGFTEIADAGGIADLARAGAPIET